MRESRFRVWNNNRKMFIIDGMTPKEIQDDATQSMELPMMTSEDCVWQQYTGFKDHNDVEIYEGDYVLCHAGVPVEEWWQYEVKWEHGRLAAHCGDYVEPFYLRLYTVVGNIFEGVKNYEYRLEEPYHLTKITVKELTND